MAELTPELVSFNRGVISPLALARVDIKRVAMSAEIQTNWMPRVLGSMSLRPGTQYLGATKSNLASRHIPFIFAIDQTAIIELTSYLARFRVGEALLTRVAVTTAMTAGDFSAATGWTDTDEGGCTSTISGGLLSLVGDGTNAAIREQVVTCAGGNIGLEHALRIVVTQGEVLLRVGTATGLDDYVSETTLRPGIYSLAFTPTGNFYVRLFARTLYASVVDSCDLEAAGVVEITTPWVEANLSKLRTEQSADVVFAACKDILQKRIERRATDSRSWAIVDYVANSGPFRVENLTPITLTASVLSGSGTLTASKPIFKSTNVGSLYTVDSLGQTVTASAGVLDVATDPILVTGISSSRALGITIAGTWVGTITLERSIGEVGSWVSVNNYTTNQSITYNDALDNQVIYYRLRCSAYTSGTATLTLAYTSGSITGIARVISYSSTTVVNVIVVKAFGALTASSHWSEGAWSPRRGYPSALAFHDGRLWWAGSDKIWASVSDDYANYDPSYVGDAGPISRSIGSGPVDTINWLVSSQRLIVGAQGAEMIARSSSLDEPMTPTNFNLKTATTYGSLGVEATKLDQNTVFVNRSGSRIYEMAYDQTTYSYNAGDLTAICPEIGAPSVVRLGIQRQLDTRVHAVRSDGKVAIMIFDKTENVKCWVLYETNGLVEEVFVLPGTEEDKVYYVVKRTINGSTVRYLERWALESECAGGVLNKQADAFLTYTGSATTSITGLSHLEGATVVCWANGYDLGTFVVTGGVVTLPTAQTNVVIGLGYTATFKSTKLTQQGLGLTKEKRVDHLGLILANTHAQGLQYGTESGYLDDLPLVENGTDVTTGYIWAAYDQDSIEVNGTFTTDTRLYLQAAAPRPCTVVGAVVNGSMHSK